MVCFRNGRPAGNGIRYTGEYLISGIFGRFFAPYGRTNSSTGGSTIRETHIRPDPDYKAGVRREWTMAARGWERWFDTTEAPGAGRAVTAVLLEAVLSRGWKEDVVLLRQPRERTSRSRTAL